MLYNSLYITIVLSGVARFKNRGGTSTFSGKKGSSRNSSHIHTLIMLPTYLPPPSISEGVWPVPAKIGGPAPSPLPGYAHDHSCLARRCLVFGHPCFHRTWKIHSRLSSMRFGTWLNLLSPVHIDGFSALKNDFQSITILSLVSDYKRQTCEEKALHKVRKPVLRGLPP